MKELILKKIQNNLIVSCQAVDDEPLNNVTAITLMAKACLEGGAKVLRLSQYEHIKSIKKIANMIPIIGLIKKHYDNSDVFITPTLLEVKQLIELDVDVIAMDATKRIRPSQTLQELVSYCHQNAPDKLLFADCDDLDSVLYAQSLGFDLVGSTLRGNTKQTNGLTNIENDYQFIKQCLLNLKKPLIAEGGVKLPSQVKDLLNLGCFAVVVGSAITRPKEITKSFLEALTA